MTPLLPQQNNSIAAGTASSDIFWGGSSVEYMRSSTSLGIHDAGKRLGSDIEVADRLLSPEKNKGSVCFVQYARKADGCSQDRCPALEDRSKPPALIWNSTSKPDIEVSRALPRTTKEVQTPTTKMYEIENCTKFSRGRSRRCVGHGGGKRCQMEGCIRAARGNEGVCIGHGGGKRCQVLHCPKSAIYQSGLCIAHGGGKRCRHADCFKVAQGAAGLCVGHGGVRRCKQEGSSKSDKVIACDVHVESENCRFIFCTNEQQQFGYCNDHWAGGHPSSQRNPQNGCERNSGMLISSNHSDLAIKCEHSRHETMHCKTIGYANAIDGKNQTQYEGTGVEEIQPQVNSNIVGDMGSKKSPVIGAIEFQKYIVREYNSLVSDSIVHPHDHVCAEQQHPQ